ncbi:MAG TPA: hypothetical protein VLV55_07990 [Rhizomicrobium sp.]|nr:hypothetical protein [Rhizomicrobium sp.]
MSACSLKHGGERTISSAGASVIVVGFLLLVRAARHRIGGRADRIGSHCDGRTCNAYPCADNRSRGINRGASRQGGSDNRQTQDANHVSLRQVEHHSASLRRQPLLAHYRSNFMIRKLKSGEYRLYSRKKNPKTGKRRNLGTFKSRAAAEKHERAVQFFKHGS